jgi:hypothetical protein
MHTNGIFVIHNFVRWDENGVEWLASVTRDGQRKYLMKKLLSRLWFDLIPTSNGIIVTVHLSLWHFLSPNHRGNCDLNGGGQISLIQK